MDPNPKKRKLLDNTSLFSSVFNNQEEDEDEDEEEEDVQLTFEELVNVNHVDCYACKYINPESMLENDRFMYLMKLYTQNASSITREAIFKQIKEYFDTYIKHDMDTIDNNEDWTLDCIREHFNRHTNFPTDEIINQIRLKRALRTLLVNNLVKSNSKGEKKFDHGNIKLLVLLDKELQGLLKLKKEITTMVGYNPVIDF